MLVRGEVDAVAIAALVGEVGEVAERQQVGGREQGEAILAGQPLAALDLGGDRSQAGVGLSDRPSVGLSYGHGTRRSASVTL